MKNILKQTRASYIKMPGKCRTNISHINYVTLAAARAIMEGFPRMLQFVFVRAKPLTSWNTHLGWVIRLTRMTQRFKEETLFFETQPRTCPTGTMRANYNVGFYYSKKGIKVQSVIWPEPNETTHGGVPTHLLHSVFCFERTGTKK